MNRAPAEAIEQQPADCLTVVDVEPLGTGDEAADVAGPPVESGREEEVRVQSRKAREANPEAPGREASPRFSIRANVVVPYVGWVADESRATLVPGDCRLRVVGVKHARALVAAERREPATRQQRRQRVGVDRDDLGVAPPRDLEGEAPAPASRVDDAGGRLAERPVHHRPRDRVRGEHLAEEASLGLGPPGDQLLSEWIAARTDRLGRSAHIALRRGRSRRRVSGEASLFGR